MNVALYARVSKDDAGQSGKLQDPDNQLLPLRQLANAMNWTIVEEFVDRSSGGDSNRPQFKLMMAKAYRHSFDLILVWRLDRFSREGIWNTLGYIRQLKASNVGLRSHQETWLDTTQPMISELLLSIFAYVAEAERKRISDNTKAALIRRKNFGIQIGRHRNDCQCARHAKKTSPLVLLEREGAS